MVPKLFNQTNVSGEKMSAHQARVLNTEEKRLDLDAGRKSPAESQNENENKILNFENWRNLCNFKTYEIGH